MSAFVFPGQGSQSPGMGKFLFENFKVAAQTYEEACDSLNFNVKKLCFEGSEAELALTENTQPAIVCTSVAAYRVLTSEADLKPKTVAGHSVGEYAALVAAGVMSFSDAMKSVRLRGRWMQEAVPVGSGGMFAVLGLDETQAQFLCQWTVENSGQGPLSPANYNCPGQIVISGSQKSLDWLKANFKTEILPGEPKRAKLIPLSVSAPFHCEMMRPAENQMRSHLEGVTFSDAKLDVIQNFHAKVETKSTAVRENLIRQICAPVLWTQTMQTFKTLGAQNVVECGQGNVLRGLFKKSDPEQFKLFGSSTMEEVQATLQTLKL